MCATTPERAPDRRTQRVYVALGALAEAGRGVLRPGPDGLVACVNPATGATRDSKIVTSQEGQAVLLLAADRTAGQVIAVLSADGAFAGIITIRPPRTCWN